ncbi:Hsp20/alpha crystallin family protein [Candidatus Bipolaricaulota bacterium]|nr:Hsp20/alpha crystallin family protein [Candidatus Bipolaricaulota bacterium]
MARLPAIWRDPFSITARMSRLMDELFRDLVSFEDFADLDLDVFPGFGHTDIYLKDKTLVIETELPGARKEDIQVRVEDNRLVITGEIRRYEEVRDENYIRMGRRYGAFRRVFPLPEEVEDKKAIRAKFENGVLRVEIPLKRAPETEGVFEVKIE